MHDRLYTEYDDNVTPAYEGLTIDQEWAEYCTHGAYRGLECITCNHYPVVPFFYSNRDFGDETNYDG